MTKNEIAYILGFLNELDDKFGNDGCNDMYLPDTPENRELYIAAATLDLEETGEEEIESVEDALRGKKKIGTNNLMILAYLRKKLMEEYSLTKKEIPDTANW